ncbi:helix-turn-helix domain-containing protein [Propionibacteriaceae bacterium Y2011]
MLDAQFERIESGDRQSWRMFHREDVFGYMWHFHPEYEITLIVHGSGTRYVGDSIEDFAIGDLVLVGPNLPHTYVSSSPAASLCCQFGDDLLGVGWTERAEFAGVTELLARSRRGLQFQISDLGEWWRTYHSDPARRTHGLLGHLIDLANRPDGRELTSPRYGPRLDRRMMTRLDGMLRYIDDHLTEPISLDDLAAVACLSPTATSRFFRRQTGRTITEYLNHTRIANACRMLTGTDEPVARIAWNCGFGNLAHFHRQFRRATGVTPGEYRRQPVRLASSPPDRQEESA